MDSEGRITTHHSNCDYYNPDKTKPIGVKNTVLGDLFECKNFSPKKDLSDFWQEEVDKGNKYCYTCVNYDKLTKR